LRSNDTALTLQERCTICLTEYAEGDVVRRMSCLGQHMFHCDCVDAHFAASKVCPLCKTEF